MEYRASFGIEEVNFGWLSHPKRRKEISLWIQ